MHSLCSMLIAYTLLFSFIMSLCFNLPGTCGKFIYLPTFIYLSMHVRTHCIYTRAHSHRYRIGIVRFTPHIATSESRFGDARCIRSLFPINPSGTLSRTVCLLLSTHPAIFIASEMRRIKHYKCLLKRRIDWL